MKRLVYITGLGHSGSTLLDLVLGAHPVMVGLGEISSVLDEEPEQVRRTRQSTCSCGRRVDECEFWGGLIPHLFNEEGSFEDRYHRVLEAFWSRFGEDVIPVDSSKSRSNIRLLLAQGDLELSVIHLIRDVRSFTVSQIDNAKRKIQKGTKLEVYSRRRYLSPLFWFWFWYKWNRSTDRLLRSLGVPHLRVGYERLCLETEDVVREICSFLRLPAAASMLDLSDSRSHVIRGNRMRRDPDKRRAIHYDTRWFSRNDWVLWAWLLRPIMRYNATAVYSNSTKKMWER
ncbi:MAG: hypothetical protein JRH07_05230 [Deltaproteobacteria bacterium]|nr:hypothetical protein [Deltaproteobacteria bacterium]